MAAVVNQDRFSPYAAMGDEPAGLVDPGGMKKEPPQTNQMLHSPIDDLFFMSPTMRAMAGGGVLIWLPTGDGFAAFGQANMDYYGQKILENQREAMGNNGNNSGDGDVVNNGTNSGKESGSDQISKKDDSKQAYYPAPDKLPGFPDAGKGKYSPKSDRKRWVLPDGTILEWDSQHGEVEVYDKSGKNHKGAYDPNTGEPVKDGKPGRWTPKFSTPTYDGPQYTPSYQPGMSISPSVRNAVIIGGATIIIIDAISTYWPALILAL